MNDNKLYLNHSFTLLLPPELLSVICNKLLLFDLSEKKTFISLSVNSESEHSFQWIIDYFQCIPYSLFIFFTFPRK